VDYLQRFKRGNIVKIADKLEPYMSHFPAGVTAIVLGSYCDQFHYHTNQPCHQSDGYSYTLLFESGGESSWYPERHLSLVSAGSEQEIVRIRTACESAEAYQTDLKWIVENWPNIKHDVPGATANYLMARIGIDRPWGLHGEGIIYYRNWHRTLNFLDPILSSKSWEECHNFLEGLKNQ
jgi:hypothetical protein